VQDVQTDSKASKDGREFDDDDDPPQAVEGLSFAGV